MQKFSKIINLTKTLVNKYESKLVDIFFWFFISSFFIDRIINYFIHFPFFVIAALIIFPFLFFSVQYKNPDKRQLYVLIFSFLIITILNSIIYLFGVKNISDLLFIILFISIYFYYRDNINNLKLSNSYLFLILCLFLFSFSFIGMNSKSFIKNEYTTQFEWINSLDENSKQIKKSDNIKWKPNPLDILEYLRVYHYGVFRLPHVASYFFGFLFLFLAYQYQKKKKILDIVLLTLSLAFCIYTGARAVLAAFVLSVIIFLFKRKYIIYLSLVLVTLLILVVANDYILLVTKNTIFYQYFTFIQTSTENFTRLSRFRLWYSWWIEVREFGFWDFMIGKSYMNALIANAKNLDIKVWFHNDFLNIFYTYGIWCTLLYIWFFIKIYRDNKIMIKRNLFIFVFYSTMVITAIINGFYYYFPVFLLYLFFLMIKQEQEIIKIE